MMSLPQEKLEEIRQECMKLAREHGAYFSTDYSKISKMAAKLHTSGEVYLVHDASLTGSGDQGWAVTSDGIFTCEKTFGMFGTPFLTRWERFKDSAFTEFFAGWFKYDDSKIAYACVSNKSAEADMLCFFDRITSIACNYYSWL